MPSAVTLHDFVLNLLTDQQAREAFASDPAGALEHAGLSDISAQDVQDVIPLVLDSASVTPPAGFPSLPAGELASGPAGAIEQLQHVTAQMQSGAPHMSGWVASAGGVGMAAPDGGFYLGGAGWFRSPDSNHGFDALRDAADQLEARLQDPSLATPNLPDPRALAGALPANPLPANPPAAAAEEIGSVLSDPTAALGSLPGASSLPAMPGSLPSGVGLPLPAVPGVEGLPGVPAAGMPSLPAAPPLPAADPHALDSSAHAGAQAVDSAAHSTVNALDHSAHQSAGAFDTAAHQSAGAFDTAAHQSVNALGDAAHTSAGAFNQVNPLHDSGLTNVVQQHLGNHLDSAAEHAPVDLPQHIDDHIGL